MRDGKSMRVAVEAGWVRARNTCLAADAVSLLAAVVLYIFAIGVVKGFAFALGLSTLIDLVVFFWFTKPMVSWLARFKFFNRGHRLSGLDAGDARHRLDQPSRHRGREGLMGKFSRLGNDLYTGKKSIDFVGRRWLWYAISAVILADRHRRPGRQGPQLRHRVHRRRRSTRVTLPADQVDQDDRRRAARGGRRHRHRQRVGTRSSPPRAARRSSSRPSRSPTTRATEVAAGDRRGHRRATAADISAGRDRRQLGRGGRRAVRDRPRWSSWSWWCCSSGPTSASGRCRVARAGRAGPRRR